MASLEGFPGGEISREEMLVIWGHHVHAWEIIWVEMLLNNHTLVIGG
jgi:hypothetical protein